MYDVSIIISTSSPTNLIRVLDYIERQKTELKFEIIIIQEAIGDHRKFNINTKLPINDILIVQQTLHYDYGANAKDLGIIKSNAKYVVFWDDDNIYYDNALSIQYNTSNGYDIGIVKTIHQNLIIPTYNKIIAGDIDTMCLCVKKDLAIKEKWITNSGKYSDFRWVNKLLKHKPKINYSDKIIGYHL